MANIINKDKKPKKISKVTMTTIYITPSFGFTGLGGICFNIFVRLRKISSLEFQDMLRLKKECT